MPDYKTMLTQLASHLLEGGTDSSFQQRDFSNLIDFQQGGAGFGMGQFSGLSGITLNPNTQGSTNPISTQQSQDVSVTTTGQQLAENFLSKKSILGKFGETAKTGLNSFWNSAKSGGTAYNLLQNGMSAANAYMNKDLVNSKGFNIANGILDGAAQIGGKINPLVGLAIKGVQTGLNAYNNLSAKQTDQFSIDAETREQMNGSYQGSYQDMQSAENEAGLKFGGTNKKAFNAAQNKITNAKLMDAAIQDINEDNQNRQAMAANVYGNTLRQTYKLNGGLNSGYLRAAKYGIKLENLNRVKHLKIKQIVNVDTKQIEEFKQGGKLEDFVPIITEPVDLFKQGGVIDEFVPIITDPIEEFKQGGKTEETELVALEETSQKNIIPEGALHKNKHHIENTEGLTQKGIPVIDNEGEQQAEIELDEIIFTLEVTKKLEELHKLYKEGSNKERDEAAIEAGKLLVQEIIYNTDDRTGLIAKCEKGGKL